MAENRPKVRATGVLVKDDSILLVKQVLKEQSHWNLPGGGLEPGDTLGNCLIREIREETGLHVKVDELLYICDRFKRLQEQVLDVSFLVSCPSDEMLLKNRSVSDDERLDAVCMVPLDLLEDYGFSARFASLVRNGFPSKGSYQGDFHDFYG